jgi:dihydroorotase
MTLYLTDHTTEAEIDKIPSSPDVVACKLYPQGATTNSHFGVSDISKIKPVLSRMAALGVPLCIHGEVVGKDVDPFDREKVFLETQLVPLMHEFPSLKIILEHITTKEAVDFVTQSTSPLLAATITPQHLLYDRSALFQGGLRPHLFCLPILKRGNPHRLALLQAIASGSPKFFLGTDSAPHSQNEKEKDCGCAGCFTAFSALELYLEAFEEADALDKFENFACHYGARFYGMEEKEEKRVRVRCEKTPLEVPKAFPMESGGQIVPLRAGEQCAWTCTVVKE